MKRGADTVAAEFAHDGKAVLLGVLLNDMADIAEAGARSHLRNTQPHAFKGNVAQPPCLDRRFADDEHAAGVAVITVLDGGDVDVEDVAVLERLVAGNAVADLMIDGNARRLGVRSVARRLVVQAGRNALLHVGHIFVAEPIQFAGRDAWLDKGRDVIEHFGRQAAGYAHFGDFFRGFENNAHGFN